MKSCSMLFESREKKKKSQFSDGIENSRRTKEPKRNALFLETVSGNVAF